MTEIQIQKRENIKQMVVDLKTKLDMMDDSSMKKKFNSVFKFIMSPNADLVKILKILGKLKLKATQVGNKEDGVDTEVQTKFWDDVIQIVIDTFKKNKELK
jgi:hypothetical protein